MKVKDKSNVHQLPPPRANRKNPERDTAVRYRAVPAAFVRRGTNGDILIPLWATTGGTQHQDAGLLQYLDALEKRISRLERDGSVAAGHAAPIEVDRPMTPPSRELSVVHNVVSIPGNEAEAMPAPDAALPIPAETVLLLPTPEKMSVPLNLVKMPVQKAANEATPAPLPADAEPVGEFGKWLFDQFHFGEVDTFRILDREFQARNKACLKTHGKTYDEVRIERKIKHLGLEKDALGNIVHRSDVLLPFDSKYMQWIAKLPQLIEERKVREVAARLAWKKAKAASPEAEAKRLKRAELARKMDIQARLPGIQLERSVKFSSIDRLAHDPVVARSSALELKAIGLMARDGMDWVRGKLGMKIPERVVERGNVGWFLDNVPAWNAWSEFRKFMGDYIPHPADSIAKQALDAVSESASQAELVRRYQRAGIGR